MPSTAPDALEKEWNLEPTVGLLVEGVWEEKVVVDVNEI